MERAELRSPLSVFWILWKWTFVLFWAVSLNALASLRRSFEGWPISCVTNSFSLAMAGYWLRWQWLDRGQGKVLGPWAFHSILKRLVSQHFSLIIIFLPQILEKPLLKTLLQLLQRKWMKDHWSMTISTRNQLFRFQLKLRKCINYKTLGLPATGWL